MYVQYIVNGHWPLANDKRAHISKKYIESDRWTVLSTSTHTIHAVHAVHSNQNRKQQQQILCYSFVCFCSFASDVRRPVVVDQTFYNNCRLQNFTQIPCACVGHLISYHATCLLLHENMWNLCARSTEPRCVTKWVNTMGCCFMVFYGRKQNETEWRKILSMRLRSWLMSQTHRRYVDSHLFIKCVETIQYGFRHRHRLSDACVSDDRTHQQFNMSMQWRKAE